VNSAIGRPVADLDDFLEPAPERLVHAGTEAAPTSAERPRRLMRWTVACLLATVAAGFAGYLLFVDHPEDGRGVAFPTPGVADTSGVAGFAELYVAGFLAGDDLSAFLPGAAPPKVTPATHYVTRSAALHVDTEAADYWTVDVAVDVLDLEPEGYVHAGIQHYRVAVIDDGDRLVAATMPSRIAGPAARNARPRALYAADGVVGDATAALVGDFMDALLTGRRGLESYVAADSGIVAVTPPPYVSVRVENLGMYPDGTVGASVTAETARGAVATLHYTLELADDGESRLVAAILGGPPRVTDENVAG